MGQKRRRLALSCVACRGRKVKCDRTYPTCVRCQKGAVSCDYVSYTSKPGEALPTPSDESPNQQREPSVASWTEEANVWHTRAKERDNARTLEEEATPSTAHVRPPVKSVQELQERVVELETYVKAGGPRPMSSDKYRGLSNLVGPGAAAEENPLQDFERALLRGKSFKTQYLGPSHASGLLLQFEELATFVKDILHRLPALEKARENWKRERRNVRPSIVLPDFHTLMSLIPDEATCNSLVQVYFEVMETSYRVLHAPTFFRNYKEFWASSSDTSPVFLVQLLLVCACTYSALPVGPIAFTGPSSVQRDTATKWVDVCDAWLDLQSQKHMTLEVFQVQVLLTIAKKMNCVKLKRHWVTAGHLLRLAMAAGLHREPTFLSKQISVFDQEMRRRLWFTILELEVQASLDRGLGASLGPLAWDCLGPLNIHDEDFDQATEKMPPPRPITEFTRTSFLCLAQQHLPLRLEMLSGINSVRVSLESHTAMELDQRIRQLLDEVPRWSGNAAKVVAQDLSKLILYEFLLLIHQPFAAQIEAQSRHFLTRISRQNAAISTVKMYSEMRPSTSLMVSNLRDDLFRALLALCRAIFVSVHSNDSLMEDRNASVKLIGRGVDIMEDRIRRLGQGFHAYWLTCSALALVQSKMSSSKPPEAHAQDIADRVAGLHREMMTLQVVAPPHGIGNGVEDAAMSTANTLVGMSGQTPQNPVLPELDAFAPLGGPQFNAFSDTLFDFDMTDIWGTDNFAQFE